MLLEQPALSFRKFIRASQVFLNYIHLKTTTYTPMPPKQRRAAAGGGQQPQKPTGKQELREQGRETGPSPPDATSEMMSRGSKLRSEFERVMEALKCSCPTVIELAGDLYCESDATCCLDVGAMLS